MRIDTPNLFWVNIKSEEIEYAESIAYMTVRMNRICNKMELPLNRVRIGELVVVREGQHWQRGIIAEIEDAEDQIAIKLRDWAYTVWRTRSECCLLEDRFRELPWQAIPCVLVGIIPATSKEWTKNDIDVAKLLFENQRGHITIRYSLSNEIAIVDFIRARHNNVPEADMATLLERVGCAKRYPTVRDGKEK